MALVFGTASVFYLSCCRICLSVLLNQVWGLSKMSFKRTTCARIVESGLASAGLACSWVDVEIRFRFTRQLVVGVETLVVA
jgi:hypothetical protein